MEAGLAFGLALAKAQSKYSEDCWSSRRTHRGEEGGHHMLCKQKFDNTSLRKQSLIHSYLPKSILGKSGTPSFVD